jgi:hypothetical protein
VTGEQNNMKRRAYFKKVLVLVLSAVLVGCNGKIGPTHSLSSLFEGRNSPASAVTQLPTITKTPSPRPTLMSTETPTPTITETLTFTPSSTATGTATPTRIPTSDDEIERGYVVPHTYDRESGAEIDYLVVFYSTIESYEIINDEEIQFVVMMQLYDQRIEGKIHGNNFEFLKHDLSSRRDTWIAYLTPDSDLESYKFLEPGKDFNLALYVDGEPTFTSVLIEDFINGQVELEFSIRYLIELVE